MALMMMLMMMMMMMMMMRSAARLARHGAVKRCLPRCAVCDTQSTLGHSAGSSTAARALHVSKLCLKPLKPIGRF